jgi:hypothetical protein
MVDDRRGERRGEERERTELHRYTGNVLCLSIYVRSAVTAGDSVGSTCGKK